MSFDFRDLVSHATSTRPLGVGTVIATGKSNRDRTGLRVHRGAPHDRESSVRRERHLGVGDTFRSRCRCDRRERTGAIAQRVVGNG
jgi:2-keto-4-pentenoate hydratase/2-oxohepta-3-ene-1,7-dioic acid hydratase in catechol pathway